MSGFHPSHNIRFSDASTYDFICTKCRKTDSVPQVEPDPLEKPCVVEYDKKVLDTQS